MMEDYIYTNRILCCKLVFLGRVYGFDRGYSAGILGKTISALKS